MHNAWRALIAHLACLAGRQVQAAASHHTFHVPPVRCQVLYGADLDSSDVGSGFPRGPPLGNRWACCQPAGQSEQRALDACATLGCCSGLTL